MRINHSRLHILVAKQLLHRADVVAVFQQMGGKAVATGTRTLLMNRNPFKFTTDAIRTTASLWTSFAACDAKAIKRSS